MNESYESYNQEPNIHYVHATLITPGWDAQCCVWLVDVDKTQNEEEATFVDQPGNAPQIIINQ